MQQKCRNRRIWMGYLQRNEEDWYWMVLRTQANSAVLRDMKLSTGTNLNCLTQQRSPFEIQTTVKTSNKLPQFLFSLKIHSLSGVLVSWSWLPTSIQWRQEWVELYLYFPYTLSCIWEKQLDHFFTTLDNSERMTGDGEGRGDPTAFPMEWRGTQQRQSWSGRRTDYFKPSATMWTRHDLTLCHHSASPNMTIPHGARHCVKHRTISTTRTDICHFLRDFKQFYYSLTFLWQFNALKKEWTVNIFVRSEILLPQRNMDTYFNMLYAFF